MRGVQDAILSVSGTTSFAELYDAVRDAVPTILCAATHTLVYLTSCSADNNFAFGDCLTSCGTSLAGNPHLL